MELLEDPTFRTKYQKNKLRVKRWENDFMEKYGRRPNKDDIRAADTCVKEAYKMYYTLKTRVLESTLLDITFPEESFSNVEANVAAADSPAANCPRDSPSPEKPVGTKNSENIDPEKSESAVGSNANAADCFSDGREETPNVDGVWGVHLNRDNEEAAKPSRRTRNLIVGRSSSFQLSQKLFSSSSLTKRNPRKSLSLTKARSVRTDPPPNETTGGDAETDGFEIEADGSMFGESPRVVRGTTTTTTTTSQPTNAVQRLINGGTTSVNRRVDHGWLERCAKDDTFQPVSYEISSRLSGTSDSGIESMNTSDPSSLESRVGAIVDKPADLTDSDDFICNSDSEDERRRKRIRNFRKRLSDEANAEKLAKRACLEAQVGADRTTIGPAKPRDPVLPVLPVAEIERSVAAVSEKREEPVVPISPVPSVSDKTQVENAPPKTTRVARATRSRRRGQDSSAGKGKAAARTRGARKKTQIPEEETAEEEGEGTRQDSSIPIYGIEATEVVPRFAMPSTDSGDLIQDFSKSVVEDVVSGAGGAGAKPKTNLTAREKLELKVKSGKVNENFVRINIKKKVFVRGKRGFNFSKYRKNQWKRKKMELSSGEGALDLADFAEKNAGACLKCGGTGHFARRCPAAKSADLLPDVDREASEFLTLEEVERMAASGAVSAHASRIDALPERPSVRTVRIDGDRNDEEECLDELFDGDFDEDGHYRAPVERPKRHKIPEELLAKLLPPEMSAVEPIFPDGFDAGSAEARDQVYQALRMFGHRDFRPGQKEAIARVLSGRSTLVTLSTGSGKSLCYQLPAYIYAKRSRCITLVVSPLVSLMDDQVTGVPKFLSAAALHTGQAPSVRERVMQTIKDGKLDILLVSPEAVVAGEKSTGFGRLLRQLPPIAFACIDEAHCISQWSHNFRPSYLMICRVLVEKLGVRTILGLTATATKTTAESIIRHLEIPDGMSGVISDTPMPKNLTLTVSRDRLRDRALVELVLSERFKDCHSIIVYCTRREECTRIAGVLRVSLQDPEDRRSLGGKCSPYAEAYHAGLTASRRKIIQKSFMSGRTRIVVATVAFGMGINKADIRSVIHYNMPASFESYVQEVGRAGRDDLPAHCHLFLSPSESADKLELRRHIFANGVDRHTIRRLLQKVFIPCSCRRSEDGSNGKRCPGHEVAIPIDETVQALDISEETISTLLCYLELHPKRFITVLSSVYVKAKVSSYAGPNALKLAAQKSPPLAMAIALDSKKGIRHDESTVIEFAVIDVAAAIGWDSGVVKSHLKNMEWQNVDGRSERSAISVNFDTLGLRVRAPGDLTDEELDEALEALAERARTQESCALRQLETIHASLNKFSHDSVRRCIVLDDDCTRKSDALKEIIREYFRSDAPTFVVESAAPNESCDEAEITNAVRSLISSYRDNNFTGRAIARIFHGIQSPNYSALAWSRCRFWRAHLSTDFNLICRIATREILATR